MKIVIHPNEGGFPGMLLRRCLQYPKVPHAKELLEKYAAPNYTDKEDPKTDRTRADLIEFVEIATACGISTGLRVVEIPDGIEWEIDEHDGAEIVHEKHRSWR